VKTTVPEYYPLFHCTASGCGHNCCREGWEIAVDDPHAALYKEIASDPLKKLSSRIREGVCLPTVRQRREGLRPSIRLNENGICPFLDPDGLCMLIRNYGESMLCQICSDHPRYRNYYADHTETGIGLCCEEAVRLVLSSPPELRYVDLRSGEPAVPEHRKKEYEVNYRDEKRKKLDISSVAGYLLSLDCLEPGWKSMLETLNRGSEGRYPVSISGENRQRIEEYLLYRHLVKKGPGFVRISLELICSLYDSPRITEEQGPQERLAEILRLYSSEIEYSEEATEAIIKRTCD